jgi:hypothetical protein
MRPQKNRQKVYDAQYPLWQNLYKNLKGDFEKLAKMQVE